MGVKAGPNPIAEKAFVDWSVEEFGEEHAEAVQRRYFYKNYDEKRYGGDCKRAAEFEDTVMMKNRERVTAEWLEKPPNPATFMSEV